MKVCVFSRMWVIQAGTWTQSFIITAAALRKYDSDLLDPSHADTHVYFHRI